MATEHTGRLVLFNDGSVAEQVKDCTCAGAIPGYPQHERHCGLELVGHVDLAAHDAGVLREAANAMSREKGVTFADALMIRWLNDRAARIEQGGAGDDNV